MSPLLRTREARAGGRDALRSAPLVERFLGAVRDPDLGGADGADPVAGQSASPAGLPDRHPFAEIPRSTDAQ